MIDELYIDGLKCDMGADSGITLEYKSNLLSDISKIVSNYSYTIKLPATSRNKRIIKGANIVSANTQFPYIAHSATVVRDGVEIVSGANAMLLSASQETIEVALSWGNAVAFQQLAEFEGNIGDLDVEQEWISWSPIMVYPSIEWAEINYGKKESIYHYCEPVMYLLDRLAERFNLSIEYPEEKKAVLDKLLLPTTKTEVPYDKLETMKANTSTIEIIEAYAFMIIYQSNFTPIITDCLANDRSRIQGRFENMSVDISFDCTVLMKGGYMGQRGDTEEIYILKETGERQYEEVGSITSLPRELQDDGWYKYIFYGVITVDNFYGNFLLGVINVANQMVKFEREEGSFDVEYFPKPKSEYGEHPKFNRIYINENLPKIKPIDLLKSVCSMLGMFAVPTGSNNIKMVSFTSLINGKPNAVDWSKKVITGVYGELGEVKFNLDNYVQKNWLRYEEDDTVNVNADAYLLCENKSLKQEQDMITLPFAPTETVGVMASIPIYSYNENAELQVSEVKDRILFYDEAKNIATFNGLSWSELISANYAEFQEVIKRSKIVSVSVRLSPVDLSVIDLTRPVYIQQAGAYFAIISIKTRQNNICDVELLKI